MYTYMYVCMYACMHACMYVWNHMDNPWVAKEMVHKWWIFHWWMAWCAIILFNQEAWFWHVLTCFDMFMPQYFLGGPPIWGYVALVEELSSSPSNFEIHLISSNFLEVSWGFGDASQLVIGKLIILYPASTDGIAMNHHLRLETHDFVWK